MIANPTIPAYRYDPYQRVLTREEYAHGEMRAVRRKMVERAKKAQSFGVVLGTLGRQGNPAILRHLESRMTQAGVAHTVFLISEMNPAKMALLEGLDAFVQIACPRLSIDWGEDFLKPVLTPYEAGGTSSTLSHTHPTVTARLHLVCLSRAAHTARVRPHRSRTLTASCHTHTHTHRE